MKIRRFTLPTCFLCALTVLTLTSYAAAPAVHFDAPKAFPVAGGGASVVGDFNGDGKLDFMGTTGVTTSTAAFIRIGNGDGTFQPARTVGTLPGTADAFAVGDFNGDGKLDLAVAYTPPAGIAVLLGNGDGTFRPAVTSPLAGIYAASMTTADFNGDGNLDLAIVDGTGVVWSLLGKGDGTFHTPVSAPLPAAAICLVSADFNGDGKPDLAVAAGPTSGATQQGTLWILAGNGDGTFYILSPFSTIFVGVGPKAIVSADFNLDGTPDVAVANGDGTVWMFLGSSSGVNGGVHYSVGKNPYALTAGDVNNDGRPDLVVANSETTSVLLARPQGFAPAVGFVPSGGAFLGDFNLDGNLDILAADDSVMLGDGKGSFQHVRTFAAGTNPSATAVADFNGDGILDLAVADYATNTVSILLGKGNGSYQSPVAYSAGYRPSWILTADINGDGIPDLAVSGAGSIVLLGNGDGTFRKGVNVPRLAGPLVAADFNGDGKLDLAGPAPPQSIGIDLGNGDGTFQPPLLALAGMRPSYVAVADFNGDGKADLAAIVTPTGQPSVVSILLGNGDGTFQSPARYAAGPGPYSLVAADFNGDGKPDLGVANYTNISSASTVAILLGKGDGSFQAPKNYSAGVGTTSLVAADLNGDGILDIAAGGATTSVLLGRGDGTFEGEVDYVPGGALAAADLNGDGKPDLVAAGLEASIAVLLNKTP